jgi:hypothetical protein
MRRRMKSNITRLQKIFFAIFLASCAGVFAYHHFWVWPKARCEAKPDHAWAGKWMKCATITPLNIITMRPDPKLPKINTDPKKMEGPSASKPAK